MDRHRDSSRSGERQFESSSSASVDLAVASSNGKISTRPGIFVAGCRNRGNGRAGQAARESQTIDRVVAFARPDEEKVGPTGLDPDLPPGLAGVQEFVGRQNMSSRRAIRVDGSNRAVQPTHLHYLASTLAGSAGTSCPAGPALEAAAQRVWVVVMPQRVGAAGAPRAAEAVVAALHALAAVAPALPSEDAAVAAPHAGSAASAPEVVMGVAVARSASPR
jgi:hypothetical protein